MVKSLSAFLEGPSSSTLLGSLQQPLTPAPGDRSNDAFWTPWTLAFTYTYSHPSHIYTIKKQNL